MTLSLVVLAGAGLAGCDRIDWHDLIDDADGDDGPDPDTNPCAYTLCEMGTVCVVQKTNPPQAACVPQDEPPPPPPRCTSTEQCAPGLVCSTEYGECQGCGVTPGSASGGAPDTAIACPAVCFGSCVPPKDPKPGACRSDSDCRATAGYCGADPCTCTARGSGEPEPLCASPPIACLRDPCEGLTAVCEAGTCVLAKGGSTMACTEARLMGGETSCKSYDTWQSYAAEACREEGLALGDFSVGGGDCPGGTRYAKYTCCR